MWTRIGATTLLVSVTILSGCGPMQAPMVPRLDDEQQQQINASWEKALQPIDQLTRQQVLDVLVVTQAYQVGVDRLTFRSEKWFCGGLVVMDVTYDRLRPEVDCFVISIFDQQGKPVRQETYDRHDVEQTNADLFHNYPAATVGEDGQLAGKRLEQEARIAFVKQFFPDRQVQRPGDGN